MRCIFVGDVSLGDHPKSVGFGFYSKYPNGIPRRYAASLLPDDPADILFGNLEFGLGASTLEGTRYEDRNCRGVRRYAKFLEAVGFTHMNVANNHTFQYGLADFKATLDSLATAGIQAVGLKDQALDLPVVIKGELSIALLGWSSRPRQGFFEAPGYAELDPTSCIRQIHQVKEAHSHVVVSLHWGDEFVEVPSPRERELARAMIDAGATVIVGHHPHVVREVEEYSGGLIAYSLGNFICDMIWNEVTRRTCYLDVSLSTEGIAAWELRQGRISDDFFPDFPGQDSSEAPLPSAGVAPLDQSTYQDRARRAHRRHRLLTLIHMVRNAARYGLQVWLAMLSRRAFRRPKGSDPASQSPPEII